VAIIICTRFDPGGIIDEPATPYGNVKIWSTRLKGWRVASISRPGKEQLPPYKINYKALVWAARKTGAGKIISANPVENISYTPWGAPSRIRFCGIH